jgi:hypothetical protein
VQDQAILHEELKCLRGILIMSLFHCSYFIKQLPNGFPSRNSVIHALGMLLDFRKAWKYTRLRLEYFYAFRKSRDIPRAWITQSCTENHLVFLYSVYKHEQLRDCHSYWTNPQLTKILISINKSSQVLRKYMHAETLALLTKPLYSSEHEVSKVVVMVTR